MSCMASPHAVLDCRAALKVITRTGMASNYVGVLRTLTPDSQVPRHNLLTLWLFWRVTQSCSAHDFQFGVTSRES